MAVSTAVRDQRYAMSCDAMRASGDDGGVVQLAEREGTLETDVRIGHRRRAR